MKNEEGRTGDASVYDARLAALAATVGVNLCLRHAQWPVKTVCGSLTSLLVLEEHSEAQRHRLWCAVCCAGCVCQAEVSYSLRRAKSQGKASREVQECSATE